MTVLQPSLSQETSPLLSEKLSNFGKKIFSTKGILAMGLLALGGVILGDFFMTLYYYLTGNIVWAC